MAIYSEFSHQKWWFSIVMLVYQRVNESQEKCFVLILLEYTEISILLSILLTILLSTLLSILSTFINHINHINHIKLSNIYIIIQMMFHFVWGAQLLREPTVSIGHLKDRICIRQPAARARGSAWTSWLSPVTRTTKTGIFVWFSGGFMGFIMGYLWSFSGIFDYGILMGYLSDI